MSKESTSGAIDAVNIAPGSQNQVEIQIDDAGTTPFYSTLARVWGSAEEFYMDFSSGMRTTGPQKATMKVDQRIVLSPWAAKRLALALAQAVGNYERAYGMLELDSQRRQIQTPDAGNDPSSR